MFRFFHSAPVGRHEFAEHFYALYELRTSALLQLFDSLHAFLDVCLECAERPMDEKKGTAAFLDDFLAQAVSFDFLFMSWV